MQTPEELPTQDGQQGPPPSTPLPRRRYRLVVEFETFINDITAEDIEAAVEQARRRGDEDLEWHRRAGERDRRLLHAVLQHPDIVDEILRGQTEPAIINGTESVLQKSDEESLLPPVLTTLPLEDREFYEGAMAAGWFAENAELYYQAADYQILEADLQVLPLEPDDT